MPRLLKRIRKNKMIFIKYNNGEYYLTRYQVGETGKTKRDWYLIKSDFQGYNGVVPIGRTNIYFDKKLIGKRVRIKLEIINDEEMNNGNEKFDRIPEPEQSTN